MILLKIFVFKFNKKLFLSFGILITCLAVSLALIYNNKSSFIVELSSNDLYDSLITNDEKTTYLTFDDGPTLKATGKILDILKEEDIKASFFVIGKYVAKHPELVKRAYDEGHFIANHGYSHNNSKLYESNDSFISEVKNTDIEIGKAIGVPDYCSHVFRFPNGYISPNYKSKKVNAVKLLEDMNYKYIDWNCLNKDSEKKYSHVQLLNNLKKSSKNKKDLIVLMHDTSDVNDTPSILKESISFLKSEGYVFKNFYYLNIPNS